MQTRFVELESIIDYLSQELKDIKSYKQSCLNQLSIADKTINDLQHCLEFEKLDAIKLTKLVIRLKNTLIERRSLKNEISLIDAIISADSSIGNTVVRLNLVKDAYGKQLQEIANQLYYPRIDSSIFSVEHIYEPAVNNNCIDSNSNSNNDKLTYIDSRGKKKTIYPQKRNSLDEKLKAISKELENSSSHVST